ncbi:MAG TPA: TolC family protein [Opitutaceae bacterium]|nr:TolC family protein [Opitutaceae bacterium]
MLRFLLRAALFAGAWAALARAQDAAPAPGAPPPALTDATPSQSSQPLTIDECVAQALAKNFSVRVQGYSVDSAKAGVIIAKSYYDPVFGVQWQKQVSQSPQVVTTLATVGGGQKPKTDNQSTSASLTQQIITGGTVTANYSLARNSNNNLQTLLNPAYDGADSIVVSQPLLAGAGSAYARAQIDLAKLGLTVANLNFRSSVLTAIFNVETAYYNLIYTRKNLEVTRANVVLAQRLLDENTTKRQTGVLTDLDVVTAQAQLATAQSQTITARQAMENAEDTLYAAMGATDFSTPVGVVDFPPLPAASASFFVSYKLARDNGPSLAIAQTMMSELKLDALRAKRNALPTLNVNAGAGYTDAEHSYTDAENQLWPGPGYNWSTGLTLSFPWGLRQSRALYRQAMDNLNQQQVNFDQADQQLIVQVRQAVRAVAADQQNVKSSSEAAVLSQKQYELQKAKFDQGLATSLDVLNAQTLLEQARVTELQAEVSLRIAIANLHFLEGSSLQAYRVNLQP